MDAASDGRMYVLDAGNHRIVALDAEGQYVTQLGQYGSGPGQFNFGDGLSLILGQHYKGSICVDDEGYIYVADVFNKRIQKFAP